MHCKNFIKTSVDLVSCYEIIYFNGPKRESFSGSFFIFEKLD